MTEPDKWSRWLAETRFGGDQKAAELQLHHLKLLRKRLLKKAGLGEGKVVLDVGAGEGLIGFGALELVGDDRAGHLLGHFGTTGRIHSRGVPSRWECWIDARS